MHSSEHLHQLAQRYNAPDYVKIAQVEDVYDQLPSTAFADPARRHYPCHTKDAIWKSAALLFTQPATERTPSCVSRLRQAARIFDVTADIDELEARITKQAATADELSDEDFAIVAEIDGTVRRHYPLRNRHEVKAAAAYVCQYRDELPWKLKQQMADRILTKAAEFGADIRDLTDTLHKLAGYGFCSSAEAVDLIHQRARAIGARTEKRAKLRNELQDVAERVEKTNFDLLPRETRHTLAEAMTTIDRNFGFNDAYDQHYKRAEDVLFGHTAEKLAADTESIICNIRTGNVYDRNDIERCSVSSVTPILGDLCKSMTKDGVYLDSDATQACLTKSSRSEARLFDSAMTTAQAHPVAFTREELNGNTDWLATSRHYNAPTLPPRQRF